MVIKFLKKILRILYSIIQIFIISILFFLSGFRSKEKKLWGFGSLGGKEFRGNSKYLYKYIEKKHKDIEIYWIAKSIKENMKLKKQGINSIYAYDFKNIKKISSTSLFFCTHGFIDLNLGLTRKAKIIMLGHMTFTIKNNVRKILLNKKNFFNRIYEFMKFSYFNLRKIEFGIFSSKLSKENLITEDNWYPQKKLILGLPKTDYLNYLKYKKKSREYFKNEIPENEKIILFLPTRRNDKKFNIFNYGFSKRNFEEFTEEKKCNFFISYHPTNVNSQIINFDSNRLKMINLDGNVIDDALSEADLLITDYGSIFADFLIFNKPIIFVKFDHDKYIKDVGLKIDYDSLPGPKVDTWNDIYKNISQQLYLKDNFSEKRNEWRNKMYEFYDGKNCERIVNYFKE